MISGEESEEEHIEKLAWSNHVVSWRNGERTVRAILLAVGAKNGKITLYQAHEVLC